MKQYSIILFLIAFTCACNSTNTSNPTTNNSAAKTSVTIVHATRGTINDSINLFGNTLYLKRNIVTAPIPAFITDVYIRLGQYVNKGDILYVLESKERRALGGNNAGQLDTSLANFGLIKVKAPASGVVTTFDHQQVGEYVLEGASLCTIAASKDLAIQVNMPYEYIKYANQGTDFGVTLPNNTFFDAKMNTALTTMNMSAQTVPLLIKPLKEIYLPENLVVKITLNKSNTSTMKQILPMDCIQSDVQMTSYWVMKMINDSIAIKVPVTLGNRNAKNVEIIHPTFSHNDSIVNIGSYGMLDTTLVSINK